MYTRLGLETLKTGEPLEVGVVRAPDADWLPRLAPFLGHKSPDYRAHILGALEGPLDALQTRFYVGQVDGRLVAQIMVVGDRGTGIVGHVYTLPEERRKGAAAHVMRRQMEDCRREGFHILTLGTGYDTHPYWIYHSFGFRGIAPDSGKMKWLAEPDAEAECLRPAPATVRDLRWDDWGYLDLLAFQPVAPGEELPRSLSLGLKGQGGLEGPFVSFQARRGPEVQAKALESETGATVGWAILAPDAHWFGDVWLLDLHTHPHFQHHITDLLAALALPQAPVAAYTSTPSGPKAAALHAAGFHAMETLPGWLQSPEGRHDVTVWMRRI